ncbi:TetR/AcrR family transcriptional regulator [Protofrankia symbiont of Coriaria ruscifolia]|uniref:TetR/AcrR family transcriptional regulator n=1 Tax=Protofrankia symbiont of Coriaria ruscifolia TaxID=1306542 RepID=UPI001041AE4D|nr:TetR/AcrR family transcriptional regulator [Protofrankia symbiont of Coriaria ruscifolia]
MARRSGSAGLPGTGDNPTDAGGKHSDTSGHPDTNGHLDTNGHADTSGPEIANGFEAGDVPAEALWAGDRRRGPGRFRGQPAKRDQILRAASTMFIQQGFARTSIDAIAASAGVSKPTVYSHFGDKETLFLAVIATARASSDTRYDIDDTLLREPAKLADDLVAVGGRLLRLLLDEDVSALRRLIISEVTHHEQLHRSCDAGPPPRLMTWFSTRIAELSARGALDVPDPARAAGQFVSLLAYAGQQDSRYGTIQLSEAQLQSISHDSADMFLRAYRPASARADY